MAKSISVATAVAMSLNLACGDDDEPAPPANGGAVEFEELDAAICSPDRGPFALEVDHDYFPLPVGGRLVLEGEEDGALIRLEITVLDEVETVAGVMTRVMEEREFEDDELIEVSRNFFAEAPDGTVCYFGEDVDDYEDGVIVGHEGAWRAGVGDSLGGIFLPGDPRPNTMFAQERAPGIAEDMAAIIALGEPISVPAGDFTSTLRTVDWNPLEVQAMEDGDTKYFVKGIGLAIDADVRLITFEGVAAQP